MRISSFLRFFLILTISGFPLLLSQELGTFERIYSVSDNPQLDIETRSGDIEITGGPYQEVSIQGRIRSQNGSGDISTRYEIMVTGTFGRNRLHGKVNDGGPRIMLRTASGDITLN